MQFMVCIMHSCGPAATTVEMELAYSKHVQDVIITKFKKVHLVGFIIQFITMHGQHNIKFYNLSRCTINIMSNYTIYHDARCQIIKFITMHDQYNIKLYNLSRCTINIISNYKIYHDSRSI
jgi:hypothetical protein